MIFKSDRVMDGSFGEMEKSRDKYLGDFIDEEGLAASVRSTVKDRLGKVRGAIMEAVSVVNDYRSQCIWGLLVSWDL